MSVFSERDSSVADGAHLRMARMSSADILRAWQRHRADVTEEEVAALLPIVEHRKDFLSSLIMAYRAGVRDGGSEREGDRT